MNALLETKLNQLKAAPEFQCWYLVKHSTNFAHLCYLVSFLKDYVEHSGVSRNLESHIDKKVASINAKKPNLKLSNNYRALRVAAFFGLIKMKSSNYSECSFTETYYEILARCNGEFEHTELYQDIITRQIEKMYVASSIDEGRLGTRKGYEIFPIMFLAKVLVEIGKVTGSYSISMHEYRYLVATTKRFEEYLETMMYIKLLRDEASHPYNGTTVLDEFKKLRDKFDNRMNKAIELLEYIDCSNDKVTLKEEYIEDVTKKVYDFERTSHTMTDEEYIDFLCSSRSLFDGENKTEKNPDFDAVETVLTPEWFRAHASEFDDVLVEAEIQYDDFQSKFSPEVLSSLSGEDLLHKMFYSESTNKDNLCYYLEFHTKVRELFGSVAGGSAYKFNLFYQKKKSSWVTGSSAKPKLLTLDEAIVLGTEIRDALVKGAEIIKANKDVSDAEGYNKLYTQLFAALGKYINLLWVQKYYHMIFPNMFPVFYNEAWQRHVLTKLNIEPYDSGFVRMGQISLFVKECDIENVIFAQIIYKYCTMVDEKTEDHEENNTAVEEVEEETMEEVRPYIELNFTTNIDCDFERNRIVFGAPGTGKSFQMEEDRAKLVEMGGGYERVTFHPDYTYSSFVGCYKPVSEKGKIEYKYVPGPFMRVLVEALRSGLTDNPKPYLLVIEEINRAKVAAVFGEVFQLLDRDSNGTSDYEIHTSEDVKKYLSDELNGSLESFARIRIPNNMFIWASMNSADQGVFPMDTAFKRRWSFEYKGIDENEDKVGGRITLGEGEHEFEVNWNVLRKAINEVLAKKFNINEDKLMGPFFMSEDVFGFDEKGYIKNPAKFKRVFKSKVIMYLYEDAAKQQKHKLFAGCDSTKYSSICDAFDKIGIDIFGADFKDTYKDME